MTEKDSRAEILIVGGVAALLLFFWLRNRSNGAGSGLSVVLPDTAGAGASNGGVPLGLTMPDGATWGDTAPGNWWNPPAVPSLTIGGPSYSLSNPGGCGCGGNGGGNTYGSASDMAGALLAGGYDMPFVGPGEAY